MIDKARHAMLLALCALIVSTMTAGVVAFDRVADHSLIRGVKGVTSPQLPEGAGHPTRIMFPLEAAQDGRHSNYMVSLAHNWSWDAEGGWTRPDPNEPSVGLTVESWYRGLAELNFDMRPPRGYTDWRGGRPMGLFARHDGTYASLFIGGSPYNPGAAGVQLTGGFTKEPIISIVEPSADERPALLRVAGADDRPVLILSGGSTPGMAIGLSGERADRFSDGVLRFAGSPGVHPLIGAAGIGPNSTILSVRADAADLAPRLRVTGEGAIEWGSGSAPADAILSRSGPRQIDVKGELGVAALRVGDGAKLRGLHVLPINIEPEPIQGSMIAEQGFPIPGLSRETLIFINGPAQPAGVGISGARANGDGMVYVSFLNLSPDVQRPRVGRYVIFAIDADE